MFLAKLTDLFSKVVPSDDLWPRLVDDGRHIGHEMHGLLHEDLRDQQRRNYNHEGGLLDLYRRAYQSALAQGRISSNERDRTHGFYTEMQLVANQAPSYEQLQAHPLIQKLEQDFCKGGGLGFDQFYPTFLEPHTHDIKLAHQLFAVLDTDGSGEVSNFELLSACKWVLSQFQGTEDDMDVVIDTVPMLIWYVIQYWVIPEALIQEMCIAPVQNKEVAISELTPTTQPGPDGVQILTGETVREFMIKNNKHTLVAFYDPDCPHCIQMLPELQAAAAALVKNTSVVIGKMDVTLNTVPEPFEVKTLPTLYFSTTGFPFVYRGLRTADAMLEFIRTKSIDSELEFK